MMEAAEKLHGLKTHADVGRLIGQYDQIMTAWKARGLPSKEVLDIAKSIGCNPYWLKDGTGDMVLVGNKAAQPDAQYVVQDSILDDVAFYSNEKVDEMMPTLQDLADRLKKAALSGAKQSDW